VNRIEKIYADLLDKYGRPHGQWVLWCKRPKTLKEKELVIIESILTQRANWKNVQIAVENLKGQNLCSLKKISGANTEKILYLIKPSGFYKQKTECLKRTADFFINTCGGVEKSRLIEDVQLRKKLLSINGIGDETADDILLYALEKPFFVVDEYTRRFVLREKIADTKSYKKIQELFEKNLKKDYALYQDFHALIVIDGKK
jgi:endonuclease-3 related protein